jgi:hypothetical protein
MGRLGKRVFFSILVVAIAMASFVAVSAALTLSAESEPNGSVASADSLAPEGRCFAVGSGSITAGDNDFWSFPAARGDRVWTMTDTGGTQGPGATSRDTKLDLLANDGTTVIENDDDDGTGNGADGTIETGLASIIAGATLPDDFTHSLGIQAFSATGVINPYRIFLAQTFRNPVGEGEANNTAGTAQAAPNCGTPVNAQIGVANDLDYYSVPLTAGQTVMVAVDDDPERDGPGTDLVVELRDPADALLLSADSSITGSTTNPAAEGYTFTVGAAGTYFVRVRHFSATGTGSYQILIAPEGNAPAHPTFPVADTTAPETFVTNRLASPSANRSPRFSFAGEDDATAGKSLSFRCTLVARGKADVFGPCSGPGNSHAPAAPLGDGEYVFHVSATDAKGNADASPAEAIVTVDGTAPAVTKLKASKNSKKGTVKIKFTAADPAPGTGVTVECKVDKRKFSACKSPLRIRGLKAGKHKVQVRATDGTGNVTTVTKKFAL